MTDIILSYEVTKLLGGYLFIQTKDDISDPDVNATVIFNACIGLYDTYQCNDIRKTEYVYTFVFEINPISFMTNAESYLSVRVNQKASKVVSLPT